MFSCGRCCAEDTGEHEVPRLVKPDGLVLSDPKEHGSFVEGGEPGEPFFGKVATKTVAEPAPAKAVEAKAVEATVSLEGAFVTKVATETAGDLFGRVASGIVAQEERTSHAIFSEVVRVASAAPLPSEEEERAEDLESDSALPSLTIRVHIEKGQSVGMALDVMPSGLLRISRVDATGPIASYNNNVPDELRVKAGDYILSVNGKPGEAKEEVLAISAGGLVEVEIRRPLSFTVAGLDKSKDRLGLDLSYHSKSAAALVEKVLQDGLINSHNAKNPERAVRGGDLIVAVNGKGGTSKELLQMIQSTSVLDLQFTRPLHGAKAGLATP